MELEELGELRDSGRKRVCTKEEEKMQGTIRFTAEKASADAAAARHRAACAAMERYLPHVVAWRCAGPGAPLVLTLPEALSAREVVQRAARARVELATAQDPAAPDRAIEVHYAHLADAEIEEGLRRLGRCLVRDLTLAMRGAASEPSFFGL